MLCGVLSDMAESSPPLQRLEREMAESSGCTRGVNSTECPSGCAADVVGFGEPLPADADVFDPPAAL